MNLNYPLISFSPYPKDTRTMRGAVRGTQIVGGIGSGKTSGSGCTIAKAFSENGFRGIILCAKLDERVSWE